MWKRFLGPHARIVGIDLRPECKEFVEDQIDIRIGDQSDKAFLLDLCKEFGAPDVVLDDGSHIMSHIHASFSVLYPQLQRNGVYLVEDLHTAYWPEYEGGLKRQESFIETCKGLIDELNADHSRGALRRLNSPARPSLCTSTTALSFLRKDGTAPRAPHKSDSLQKSRWRLCRVSLDQCFQRIRSFHDKVLSESQPIHFEKCLKTKVRLRPTNAKPCRLESASYAQEQSIDCLQACSRWGD